MKKPLIYDRLEQKLEDTVKSSRFRSLAPVRRFPIDLSTNSYLAIEECEEVHEEAMRLLDGDLTGNLASRLIGSRSSLYKLLEQELANWKQTEAALLFNSGYAANLGILQALSSRNTVVFSDRLNHASIVDGIRLSGAQMVRYRHCDMDDLSTRLGENSAKEKIIITDSVFSMDGDLAPLPALCDLACRFGALVIVDEAHAGGIFGERRSGLVEQCGVEDAVDVRVGTLSKAVGGLGGFFAGSRFLYDYLVNTARSLIYSTALPHSVLAFDLAAIRYIRTHPNLGTELLQKADDLREKIGRLGFNTLNSTTQIVPCIIGDDKKALELSNALREKGIKVPSIRPPTVPKGTSRLRFSVHNGMKADQVEAIVDVLKEWKKRI
ncbi:MAG: aminotransferase class I/II-fold pyridoxal phosphate-dependent enzyme [Fibrobacterota bacterium]